MSAGSADAVASLDDAAVDGAAGARAGGGAGSAHAESATTDAMSHRTSTSVLEDARKTSSYADENAYRSVACWVRARARARGLFRGSGAIGIERWRGRHGRQRRGEGRRGRIHG